MEWIATLSGVIYTSLKRREVSLVSLHTWNTAKKLKLTSVYVMFLQFGDLVDRKTDIVLQLQSTTAKHELLFHFVFFSHWMQFSFSLIYANILIKITSESLQLYLKFWISAQTNTFWLLTSHLNNTILIEHGQYLKKTMRENNVWEMSCSCFYCNYRHWEKVHYCNYRHWEKV